MYYSGAAVTAVFVVRGRRHYYYSLLLFLFLLLFDFWSHYYLLTTVVYLSCRRWSWSFPLMAFSSPRQKQKPNIGHSIVVLVNFHKHEKFNPNASINCSHLDNWFSVVIFFFGQFSLICWRRTQLFLDFPIWFLSFSNRRL